MLEPGLEGKVALITGGTRGIGRATAELFARAGVRVMIGYLRDETSAKVALAQLRAAGAEAEAHRSDLTTAEGCASLHTATTARFGPVDILVNCAAMVHQQPFVETDDATWERVLTMNTMAVVRMCRLVAPEMMARRWGRIINVSSCTVHLPGRGLSAYAAAKSAVEALTRTLAVELAGPNMTVNCISPGVIDTHDIPRRENAHLVIPHQLIRRMGRCEEVASWMLLLASRYGDYMTGQVMRIDGGLGLGSNPR